MKWTFNILRTIWVLAAVVILLVSIAGIEDSHTGAFFSWSMILLGFPINYLLFGLVGILIEIFEEGFSIPDPFLYNSHPYFHYILLWTLSSIAGYLQWFKLVPFLYKKIRQLINQKFRKIKENPS
ncbi:MAG: hypothetical protein G3M70_10125 [Candidatus Nitronauta litoralis]|uniref:Uncharacterized protein n=1 Tax=Candidatus Nitronauta litoralis TaxID=2705533 RepID=A0A7T0BWB5_9BACT|nr:MAG: hypothetical protein G3M70_10125 [Candidatus Nitronauta litoralis]